MNDSIVDAAVNIIHGSFHELTTIFLAELFLHLHHMEWMNMSTESSNIFQWTSPTWTNSGICVRLVAQIMVATASRMSYGHSFSDLINSARSCNKSHSNSKISYASKVKSSRIIPSTYSKESWVHIDILWMKSWNPNEKLRSEGLTWIRHFSSLPSSNRCAMCFFVLLIWLIFLFLMSWMRWTAIFKLGFNLFRLNPPQNAIVNAWSPVEMYRLQQLLTLSQGWAELPRMLWFFSTEKDTWSLPFFSPTTTAYTRKEACGKQQMKENNFLTAAEKQLHPC